jgi:hypothetical protein
MDVVIVLTPKFTTVVLPSIAKIEEVDDEEVDDEEVDDEELIEVLVLVMVVLAGLSAPAITPKSWPWAVPNDRVAPDIEFVRASN